MPEHFIERIDAFLDSLSRPWTQRSYRSDLIAFAQFVQRFRLQQEAEAQKGVPEEDTLEEPWQIPVFWFLTRPKEQMQQILVHYKQELQEQGLVPATINGRLAALRALLHFAYANGDAQVSPEQLAFKSLLDSVQPYRATNGVDQKTLKHLLALPDRQTLRGLRDAAILHLLGESGLRRQELAALDVGDFSQEDRRVHVPPPRHENEKVAVSVSAECAEVMGLYLAQRVLQLDQTLSSESPLFTSLDRNPRNRGARLKVEAISELVAEYAKRLSGYLGQDLEKKVSPRSLRNGAITRQLEQTDGDLSAAREVGRHGYDYTLVRYAQNWRKQKEKGKDDDDRE